MTAQPTWTPYADATSGHQGDTSQRAEPRRRRTIDLAFQEVSQRGSHGLTWRELADLWNEHHGVCSGALSNLHRSGSIVRLRQTRDRCGVYVVNAPQFIQGRPTIPHRSNKRPKEVTREQIAAEVHAWMLVPGEHEEHLIDRMVALLNKEKVQ